MVVTLTTAGISRAKLQSNHHHQQTNNQFFSQAGCPSCRPTNSVKALKGSLKLIPGRYTTSCAVGRIQGRGEYVQDAVEKSREAGEVLHWTGGERESSDDDERQQVAL